MVKVEIPQGLIQEIDNMIEAFPELAYETREKFVAEALRDYFLKLKGITLRAVH